jgi:hypothetical protein
VTSRVDALATSTEFTSALTEAGGLVPPALGFIFDREMRNERRRTDLGRESDGLVAFTSRRKYENYLLNPRAIEYVASRIEGFREEYDTSGRH